MTSKIRTVPRLDGKRCRAADSVSTAELRLRQRWRRWDEALSPRRIVAMDLGLKGKVAIVTGGSRGIGRSIALGFAAEGCDVAICARGEETLRATEEELAALGVRTFAQAVDVTQAGQSEAFVDAAT